MSASLSIQVGCASSIRHRGWAYKVCPCSIFFYYLVLLSCQVSMRRGGYTPSSLSGSLHETRDGGPGRGASCYHHHHLHPSVSRFVRRGGLPSSPLPDSLSLNAFSPLISHLCLLLTLLHLVHIGFDSRRATPHDNNTST